MIFVREKPIVAVFLSFLEKKKLVKLTSFWRIVQRQVFSIQWLR